jgi:hypothetical protein
MAASSSRVAAAQQTRVLPLLLQLGLMVALLGLLRLLFVLLLHELGSMPSLM